MRLRPFRVDRYRRAARDRWRGATGATQRINARYDRELVEVMRRVLAADSSCIDVGANEGAILRDMVSLAPAGSHVAVEPLPELAARLERPSVRVIAAAASDEAGTGTFRRVTTAPALSGFVRRAWDTYDERDVELVEVPTVRLDDVIDAAIAIRLVKIDVEGWELHVLRGARELLRRERPFVALEIGPEKLACFAELASAGLHVSTMRRWLRGRPPFAEPEQMLARGDWCFLAYPA